MSDDAEQQAEEIVLKSIYDGDENFKQVNPTTYQYKYTEGDKSFILEIIWGPDYPTAKPKLNMDIFYNQHLLQSVKDKVMAVVDAEAAQWVGCAMTYTLFECLKDRVTEVLAEQAAEVLSARVEKVQLDEDEELGLDSGSEAEEDQEFPFFTNAELLEMLETEDPEGPEDNEDVDLNSFTWSGDFANFRGEREEFTQEVGPTIEGTSPIAIFSQFWDQPIMEKIAQETNEYAWQTIAAACETEVPPQARFHAWVETSVSQLYRLFAVLILMGMCVRGRVDEYWTTGRLSMPMFRKLMNRNQFLLLMRFLHFVNNNTLFSNGADRKLAKIKPILDHLNAKFTAAYKPRRELSLDESLLLWKGNLSWIQCIRTKAARFGIKMYVLAEAVSGYVLKFKIYTGKNTGAVSTAVMGFTSATAKIVLDLMEEYLRKGYTLFMDNFYNSVALCRFLKSQKTDVIGTLNRRRTDTPAAIQSLNEKRVARGTVVSQHCGDVAVLSWKDVKLVTTVSTYHKDNMVEGHRAGAEISKPEVVATYNSYMGGVDLKDQMLSMYLMERKRGLKWQIKVFRHLLNVSILNSYIIYNMNVGQGRTMTHRQFRYRLAEELAQQHGMDVRTVQPTLQEPLARLDRSLDHYPENVPVSGDRSGKDIRFKRGNCVRCAVKKDRKVVNLSCGACHVFLCPGQCWKDFHKLENL